ECGLVAEALHRAREHHTAAVYNDELVPFTAELRHGAREALHELFVFQRCATDFYDDLHCNPSRSFKPNIRFMFCPAWPAAPLTRLSRHETSTARRPSGDRLKPMSQ